MIKKIHPKYLAPIIIFVAVLVIVLLGGFLFSKSKNLILNNLALRHIFTYSNVGTFISQDLGISFKYLVAGTSNNTILTKAVGNKVYVYPSSYKPEEGHYVEVFKKEPNVDLTIAVTRDFLNGYSASDCVVEPYKYISGAVSIKSVDPWFNDYSEPDTKVKKCPLAYTYTNTSGISFFMTDNKYPNRYAFFNVGQYPISGDTLNNSWVDTFQFLK